MDCSPPGSSVHGIFQARVLEWGATAFSQELPATQQMKSTFLNTFQDFYYLYHIIISCLDNPTHTYCMPIIYRSLYQGYCDIKISRGRKGRTNWESSTDTHTLRVLVAQSCLTLCDPVDCSRQAPLSMGFSRQEYWSGFPFPSPGHLPNPGIKPLSPALQANSLLSQAPGKPSTYTTMYKIDG